MDVTAGIIEDTFEPGAVIISREFMEGEARAMSGVAGKAGWIGKLVGVAVPIAEVAAGGSPSGAWVEYAGGAVAAEVARTVIGGPVVVAAVVTAGLAYAGSVGARAAYDGFVDLDTREAIDEWLRDHEWAPGYKTPSTVDSTYQQALRSIQVR